MTTGGGSRPGAAHDATDLPRARQNSRRARGCAQPSGCARVAKSDGTAEQRSEPIVSCAGEFQDLNHALPALGCVTFLRSGALTRAREMFQGAGAAWRILELLGSATQLGLANATWTDDRAIGNTGRYYVPELCAGILLLVALATATRIRCRPQLSASICEKYQLDPDYGFLPARTAPPLPKPFDHFEMLGKALPELNRTQRLVQVVDELDTSQLPQIAASVESLSEASLRRLYVLLSLIAHSYVSAQKAELQNRQSSNRDRSEDGDAAQAVNCQLTTDAGVKSLTAPSASASASASALASASLSASASSSASVPTSASATAAEAHDGVQGARANPNTTLSLSPPSILTTATIPAPPPEPPPARRPTSSPAPRPTSSPAPRPTSSPASAPKPARTPPSSSSARHAHTATSGTALTATSGVALPTALAVPWRVTCATLQMPTVLTATGSDLWNRPGYVPEHVPRYVQPQTTYAPPFLNLRLRYRFLRFAASCLKATTSACTYLLYIPVYTSSALIATLTSSSVWPFPPTAMSQLFNPFRSLFPLPDPTAGSASDPTAGFSSTPDPTSGFSFTSEPSLETFELAFSMTGTRSERGFHALPFAIQLLLSPLLSPLLRASDDVRAVGCRNLCNLCRDVAHAMGKVRHLLASVDLLVDATEFYDVYRPLLGGWDSLPAGGLLLCSDARFPHLPPLRVAHKGPSAGQTAMLMLIDDVLGITHRSALTDFRTEMRDHYLPAPHARLLRETQAKLRAHGSVRDAAAQQGGALARAHAHAVDAVAAVRAEHLAVACRFLRKTGKGTGGSDFRPLLCEALRSTREAREGT